MFIDYAKITIKAGNGGDGIISFRKEKYISRGGPDGGNGGHGGSVIAIGDENVNTLLAYKYHRKFYAEDGKPGSNARKRGLSGDDIYLHLPLGTEIYQITETGERIKIADITTHNEEIILAHGGRGGKGNSNFATSTNQAPRIATPGRKTKEIVLELVLKLMADVGLVGFPNAGKSTLLSVLSSAKPKIADYEFTTLEPMLGVVPVTEYQSFVMADIPGIIEGAHQGKGLGHQFLQHIQRTSVLLFLIDINTPDPLEAFRTLHSELYLYDPFLDKKPSLIVLSKLDTIPEEERNARSAELQSLFQKEYGLDVLPISAVGNLGIEELKWTLYNMLDKKMTDKFKAWLCLKSAFGTKPKTALELVKKYPHPEEYVGNSQHPIYEDDTIPPQIKEQLLSAVPHPREEQIAKLCEHYEINAIFYGDEDYPLALANIILPPLILYYRGDLLKALNNISLAVVGTRKPTAYGKNACSKLLAPVCQREVTIVSGLAYGIDTVSHITALQNGAMTIAVLASGVENIYPPANRELAKEIINNGALVSEYEPGTKLESWNFPARNRIISALAPVTFVVEGSMTSGAMITAKHALEQNHDLIALPGEIYHPNAQGPNYLIKNGAQCITCPEDILYALGIEVEEREQLEFLPEISPDEQKIYDLFREEQRELSFDELLLKTGYSFGKLSTILLNLELKGLIIKSGGNAFLLS